MGFKDDTYKTIREMIFRGEMKKAKVELGRLLKHGPFSAREKMHIALWHYSLGDTSRAIKTAGKELSEDELMVCSLDELALQNRLAYFLHAVGARYSGLRIFNKIDKVLKQRELALEKSDERAPLFKILVLRMSGLYEEVLEIAAPSKEFYRRTNFEGLFINCGVNQADALRACGKIEEADNVLSELEAMEIDNKVSRGLILRAKASNILFFKDAEHGRRAMAVLEKAENIFPPQFPKTEAAVVQMLMGEACFLMGDGERAKKHLIRSNEILHITKTNSTSAKANYYYLHKMPGKNLTFEQELALKCHHVFSSYSFLVGKRYDPAIHMPLDAAFKDKPLQHDKRTWLIMNGAIMPEHYEDALEKALASSRTVLDLYSGLKFEKRTVVDTIPDTQLRCLAPVYGSGELGINKWALIDLIYREEEFCFNYGEERLKYLISELKKRDFPIVRKKNFYYYDYTGDETIIMPMDVPSQRVWLYLKTRQRTFHREDIESLYGVHKATANRWIKSWLEDGIISTEDGLHRFL